MNTDAQVDLRKEFIEVLTRLGVASLSEYIGTEKLERYYQTGQELDVYSLAEILITEHGLNILKNKNLRLELLASFGSGKLVENLKLESPIEHSLNQYNDFVFGNNEKTKKFLQFLGLPEVDIFQPNIAIAAEEEVEVSKSLHSYQNWIRKKINYFLADAQKKRVIVHMPTGSGKTRTMLEAVCDHIRHQEKSAISVVWLAHSEELCEQSIESFQLLWQRLGTEKAQIIRLWGGSRPEDLTITCPTFVVASFQTAYNMFSASSDEQFSVYTKIRSSCTLLVIDEAHQSTAPTYKDAIELFSDYKTKIVGLTATPGRHRVGGDAEETKELAEFYEENKINILDDEGNDLQDPIGYLTEKGVLAHVTRYKIDSGTDIQLSASEIRHMERLLEIPRSVLEKLGKDATRTNLIVTQAIKLAVEEQLQTIIFAPSKESAIEIATILMLRDVNAVAITSETSHFDRKEGINKFRSGEIPILANFGVLTTGFDAPNIKAVIIARPTTSVVLYSQMIGRGLRGELMGGEAECYLIDIIDNIVNMPEASQAFTFFDEYYG